ncbi:uncharacterized protein SCHCODRAFT_02449219, partial [Schizophyllum commune H4-8]|uniref:uncharacterized protein n=1 Tax=Schizophyllum commune (strain H4-8 / FGSC 9210) TaxID=578458 RepID=UPI002160959F
VHSRSSRFKKSDTPIYTAQSREQRATQGVTRQAIDFPKKVVTSWQSHGSHVPA